MKLLKPYLFTLLLGNCIAQHYSTSCEDSFHQDYGLIKLPLPILFRQPPAIKCIWNFTVNQGDTIVVSVHKFNVARSFDCTHGYVEILDGLAKTSDLILPKTCSQIDIPSEFSSSSNELSVIFYSTFFSHNDELLASVRTVSSNIFYKLHTEAMSWMDAREFCQKDNGDLASVYPVPTRNLADLVEADVDFTDAWVGMFVTPWVRLKGCISWSNRQGVEPKYYHSKYNQKIECSVACLGSSIFLLQGNSCFCLAEPSNIHLNEIVDARECNIPCPGNEQEVCGGPSTFTYYRYYDETIHNQVPYQDCVVDSLSLFESKDCNSKFGFTCSLNNGSAITYYSTNNLPWYEARAFCQQLPGSYGIRDYPHWPRDYVSALWTSITRGQHWNFPQVYDKTIGPEHAYVAIVDTVYHLYELKTRNASQKFPFLCEYRQSQCVENYTSSSGSLSTPGYPENYSHNQFCKLNIAASQGYTIRLEFLHFQIESHELCFYDYVQVIDSALPRNLQETRYCGGLIPQVFQSEGENITVIFRSDNSVAGKGFIANWRTVHPKDKDSSSSLESRSGISGAVIAGIVIAVAAAGVALFLLLVLICKRRYKQQEISGSTVSNQVYGVSSFSNDSITDGSRSRGYVNLPGHSNTHTNQQFNIHLIRDEADDINDDNFIENDHYRLEIDTEYYENSGSQANLIASDNDTTPPNHNQNLVRYRDNTDSITVESTLTLDDIDNLGMDNITVVESFNEENGQIDDNQVYKGASNKTKLLVDLESSSNSNKNFQNSAANTSQDVNVSTDENYSNKRPVKYNNLFNDRMHPSLVPAPSNVYEEMCVGNDSKNIPMTHTLLENEHVPATNVPSNAYAEIRDIDT